jgi:hypothetical protein
VKEIEMSNGESISLDKLVKTYIKIRERRSELKAEFDAQDAPLVQQLETVKGALLNHCKEHDVEHAEPSLLDKRINQKNMKQFLEENPELLPKGLNSNSEYTIAVRRNKK